MTRLDAVRVAVTVALALLGFAGADAAGVDGWWGFGPAVLLAALIGERLLPRWIDGGDRARHGQEHGGGPPH